ATINTRLQMLSPRNLLCEKLTTVNQAQERLAIYAQRASTALKSRLERTQYALENLDPSRVLQRGYAIVSHQNNIITDPVDIPSDAILDIRLAHGKISAKKIN
ncbi:MAG: exodeoxyribonuclease VII large subunit, partial [Victivallaceae bacterium]|nr:exodeoxyribonuclease VII large subunit [Victivallaceae bacterium]